ncbi:hypothetical protein [Streptomyces sp. NPDC052225]|uniref:hypothetical protein n=1 Tax=Streptomyces sp. NPDC052225 TaxID=3154949 RepID=UPI0034486774
MLKHAIPPARFFSQIPNEIIRHPRLNGTAVRLLSWALSLPEGSRETVQSLGEKMPEGRIAVRKARRQLEEEGYLHTRRTQDPETGQWTTQVLVSNVPLTSPEEIADAFGPGDRNPAAGDATGQAVGSYPLGETPEDNTPDPAPVEPDAAERAAAADFLVRLGDRAPELRLAARDIEHLAPLAVRWLAAGVTEADLRQVLTADLPRPVRAPAALVRYRLENRTPAPSRRVQAVRSLGECAECRDPLPRGAGRGICRRCAGLESSKTSVPAPARTMREAIDLVRAALRPVDAGA